MVGNRAGLYIFAFVGSSLPIPSCGRRRVRPLFARVAEAERARSNWQLSNEIARKQNLASAQ